MLFLAGGVCGFVPWRSGPAAIQVRRYTVAVEAPALKDLRVAVISDLHAGAPHIDLAKIDKIVAMTNAEEAGPDPAGRRLFGRPDDGREPDPDTARYRGASETAQGAAGRLCGVIGNHDRWRDPGQVFRFFPANGIPVLENRSVDVGRFWVTGISDEHTHAADPVRALKPVPKGATALCFTHSPDTFADLSPMVWI